MDRDLQNAIVRCRDAVDAKGKAADQARQVRRHADELSEASRRSEQECDCAMNALVTAAGLANGETRLFAFPDGRTLVLRSAKQPGVRYLDIVDCVEVTDGT